MAYTPLKTVPKKFAGARKFASPFLRLRYRFDGMQDEAGSALPDDIIEALAPKENDYRNISFTFAIIALSARVAQAGSPLTAEKYVAFREAFPLKGRLCRKIRQLFLMACKDTTPIERYVTQIKFTFPKNAALFSSMVERLFSIASADGIAQEEERLIAKIARGLEIGAPEFSRIRERFAHKPKAHEVLGLEKRAKGKIIKQRYRELMKRYHPDQYAMEEVSPEVALILQLRSSEINEAYKALSKRAA